MLSVDVFWSFRSPYCYLLGPRLLGLARDFDVSVHIRPIYPIAIRVPGYFRGRNPMARRYLVHDVVRIGEMLGLSLVWPTPDPIAMNLDTGEVYADQPYISRLTRLAIAAVDAGRGLEFALYVSSLIFGGTKNWHEGDHLRTAVSQAGLDIDKLDDVARNDVDRLEAAIRKNEADHQAAGHWGVPLMTFQNEPFFGQDRYDVLMWRLRQHGLKARAGTEE